MKGKAGIATGSGSHIRYGHRFLPLKAIYYFFMKTRTDKIFTRVNSYVLERKLSSCFRLIAWSNKLHVHCTASSWAQHMIAQCKNIRVEVLTRVCDRSNVTG